MSVPVQSAGSGGKVLTAFIAGLTLGVIGMVEIAPSSLAGSAGTGSQPQAAVPLEGQGPTEVASDGGTGADVEVGAAQPRTADPSGADGGGDGTQGSTGGGGAAGSVGGGGVGSAGASGGGDVGGSGCAANNGGATDTGVSAAEIKVAATTVTDGPGATLLAPATDGMRAVIDKVNGNGGICGRRITLTTRNDTWDDKRGRDFLRKFIEDGNFSLLVVPSSEGLALAIETDLISDNKIPVVGSTGLREDEYSDPWVFPVSTATVSIMRIMATQAAKQGAETFGIVWDELYKFGQEGRDAFVAQVERLGGTVTTDVELNPDSSDYYGEANTFNSSCEQHGCDMVALLMVPSMGIKWIGANGGDGQGRGTQMTYGAQTLFTNDFATECGGWCNGLVVWTGYNPSIGSLADRPDIRQYRTDVRNVNPSADIDNQFLQGAYLGSKVFVEAVTQCSPNVTRVCVRDTLNQMDYASDLSSTLSWRPNKRHANTAARAFRMQASQGSFNGWQDTGFGFVEDPQL